MINIADINNINSLLPTNGDVFKSAFPNIKVEKHIDSIVGMISGYDVKIYTSKNSYFTCWFPSDWWEAEYDNIKFLSKQGENNAENNSI